MKKQWIALILSISSLNFAGETISQEDLEIVGPTQEQRQQAARESQIYQTAGFGGSILGMLAGGVGGSLLARKALERRTRSPELRFAGGFGATYLGAGAGGAAGGALGKGTAASYYAYTYKVTPSVAHAALIAGLPLSNPSIKAVLTQANMGNNAFVKQWLTGFCTIVFGTQWKEVMNQLINKSFTLLQIEAPNVVEQSIVTTMPQGVNFVGFTWMGYVLNNLRLHRTGFLVENQDFKTRLLATVQLLNNLGLLE